MVRRTGADRLEPRRAHAHAHEGRSGITCGSCSIELGNLGFHAADCLGERPLGDNADAAASCDEIWEVLLEHLAPRAVTARAAARPLDAVQRLHGLDVMSAAAAARQPVLPLDRPGEDLAEAFGVITPLPSDPLIGRRLLPRVLLGFEPR
jgi:hypothetical protein